MADKMTDREKQDAHNARKVARRAAEKSGAVKKGDGNDVDHKTPLSKGGSAKLSNTRVTSSSKNRSEGGKIGGKMVTGAAKEAAGSKGGKVSSRKGIPNKKK
tara:strand:- start:534 stop:839 length:306 start_codon:yes stop_codon:yes gene_type:complete